MKIKDIPEEIITRFKEGVVIPAQPLALDESGKNIDIKYQKALTKYYIDAGVGGIACGVHSTQFEIREPEFALYEPVLSMVAETIDNYPSKQGKKILKISGVCGSTDQALQEAQFSVEAGYHASLLSLAALKDESNEILIEHCRKIAEVIPIIGFYLQPAVGGKILNYDFWRKFAEIPNVLAIKMAPFNRYQTFDVIRAVCEAGKEKEIMLYTGNDDNIVVDLLTKYRIKTQVGTKSVRIIGGLLGHWCCWTRSAVKMLEEIKKVRVSDNGMIPDDWLTRAVEVTDTNAALFDTANNFAGCIPGIHEVLKRQGLLRSIRCLNPDEVLSPGQSEELDRIYKSYPDLNDDEFVRENLENWLSD